MTERERLASTLGILLAGLLRAEAEAEVRRRSRPRSQSGVFRVGEDGLGPTDVAPEPEARP